VRAVLTEFKLLSTIKKTYGDIDVYYKI